MYSLDINFLNDRPELKPEAAARTRTKVVSAESKTPLYLGMAAGLLIPGIVGAIWLILQSQNNQLTEQQAQLDSQLNTLKTQLGEVDKLRAQVTQTRADTEALATVFNQIKPWSALAQDLRDRIPTGIQIYNIEQTATAATPPAPAPTPSPGASPAAAAAAPAAPSQTIKISGEANSFDNVNDFLLMLQRSNFTDAATTRLVKAELTRPTELQPIALEGVNRAAGADRPPKLPPRVSYEIETSLNNVPASELVRELERKGAVGLVTRIENLRERGIIAPEKGGSQAMTKDFIPDSEFEPTPQYPTVFGITLTPPVSGVLIALLGLAAAAYLGVNFVLPAWDQYQLLKADVERKRNDIQQQEAALKNIQKVKAELEAERQRQEEVLALFANEKTLDTLLIDLNRVIDRGNAGVLAATRNKLRSCPSWVRSQFTNLRRVQDFEDRLGPLVAEADLQLFEPDPRASGVVTDSSLGANVNNKLKRQTVNVRFVGNFNQTQSILRSIERLQPLLIVSDFKAARANQTSSQTAGLYQIENGRVRFLTNCQPEALITTTFKLQALIPLSPEETAAANPAPSPSPTQ